MTLKFDIVAERVLTKELKRRYRGKAIHYKRAFVRGWHDSQKEKAITDCPYKRRRKHYEANKRQMKYQQEWLAGFVAFRTWAKEWKQKQ